MTTPTPEQIDAALAWTDDSFTDAQRAILLQLVSAHPSIDSVTELVGCILAAALVAAREDSRRMEALERARIKSKRS